jgi:hypothetical protein
VREERTRRGETRTGGGGEEVRRKREKGHDYTRPQRITKVKRIRLPDPLLDVVLPEILSGVLFKEQH